jgi:cytochrome oxidase Cu insertion factor (SCO1/SenC/PrrC family)
MTRTLRWLLTVMLAALLVVLSACSGSATQNPSETADLQVAPVEGAHAPELTLSDLSGTEWTLSELRGKVILLNFWATW